MIFICKIYGHARVTSYMLLSPRSRVVGEVRITVITEKSWHRCFVYQNFCELIVGKEILPTRAN